MALRFVSKHRFPPSITRAAPDNTIASMKISHHHLLAAAASVALFVVLPSASNAVVSTSISLASVGEVYSQDFDGLAGTTFSSTAGEQFLLSGLDGWQAAKISGTGTSAMPFSINNGSGNSGGIHSYGPTGGTDRALGSIASGTNIPAFGVAFVNDTGSVLNKIAISFTAEFWRSSTTTQNVLTFGYGFSGGSLTDANYLSSPAALAFAGLNIVGPAPVAANGALDGDLSANQTSISAELSGLLWEPGQALYLRWQDNNDVGNDAGLALDNFTFTAIPEPTSYALLLGAAALGLAARRRRLA